MKHPRPAHFLRKIYRLVFYVLVLSIGGSAANAQTELGAADNSTILAPFTLSIGHGGGRFKGIAKTNSYDALNANIDRFVVQELDFEWTADGELVCIHNWDTAYTYRFGIETDTPPDYATFRRLLTESPEAPGNCDLDGLANWMRAHPALRIVTDVKSNPVAAHELIADRHPDLLSRFLPQAYKPDQIDFYRSLGFPKIIWTLYRYEHRSKPEIVIQEAQEHMPDAITMPASAVESGLMRAVIEGAGLPVYVHTINQAHTTACLLKAGAAGIYSDDLSLADVEDLQGTDAECN